MITGKGVWVFAEVGRDELKRVSLEMICEGTRLADKLNEELCAVLLGDRVEHLSRVPPLYGASKVYLIEHESLSPCDIDPRVNIATNLIKEATPRIVLFGATSLGRELAPRVAARLRVGLVTECIALEINNGQLVARKPIYGGKAHATFAYSSTPQIATVAPGVMDVKTPDKKAEREIVRIAPNIEGEPRRVESVSFVRGDPRAINLAEAEIIVAVGRGLGNKENLHIIEELGDLLGASVGGSRAAIDSGWLLQERQIGMTGKTVTPRLLVSCGISGQYPHIVGMDSSETIIVINTDRNAPMFKLADLGILGDLNEVVPAITKLIRESIALREKNSQ